MSTSVRGGKGRCNRSIEAGIASSLEFAFSFLQWAGSLTLPLTHDLIEQRYGCSRATAYRWANAYRAWRARVSA